MVLCVHVRPLSSSFDDAEQLRREHFDASMHRILPCGPKSLVHIISVGFPFCLHSPVSANFFPTVTFTTRSTMLSSRALLRRARVPPAAAVSTCAGNNNFSWRPEPSVSQRRWRSTKTDASPPRHFAGLLPSDEPSFSAWSNWGLPQLLVNVPKGKARGSSLGGNSQ